MSFNKNQKSYNKKVMRTGETAINYLNNSLGLINQYTSNYGDRLDYYTNKLSNKQLDLLSDKYLAQNAAMLRNQAQFGSNSETNRQIENNAYDQQNYLASVANKNVELANQLQNNEVSNLYNASNLYSQVMATGGQAAQNVDAANNSWLSMLGMGANVAGTVLSAVPTPWTQAVGAGLQTVGSGIQNVAGTSTDLTPTASAAKQAQTSYAKTNFAQTGGLTGRLKNLSTNKNRFDSGSTNYFV